MIFAMQRGGRIRSLSRIFALLSASFASVLFLVSAAWADGTETLGDPSIGIAQGTGVIAAGAGLGEADSNTISLSVPQGATVQQVLLYWSGESPVGPDDTIRVDGIEVTGTAIGGPTLFFADFDATAFRADITELGLIGPGANSVTVDDLFFSAPPFDNGQGNHGAGLLVIVDDGMSSTDIQLRDGLDLAFCGFPPPRTGTVAQTYSFEAADFDRSGAVSMFFGSAGDDDPVRPSHITLMVDNGASTTLENVLVGADGNFWDTVTVPVEIPADSTSLTVQAFSGPADGTCPSLSASLSWIASALAVNVPAVCGNGVVDEGEECDDGNDDNFDLCRNDCTLPFCGDGIQDPGEQCDDGNDDDFDSCRNDCTLPFCGDGILDEGEQCDDGNNMDGDGCSATCMNEDECKLRVDKKCVVLGKLGIPLNHPADICAFKIEDHKSLWWSKKDHDDDGKDVKYLYKVSNIGDTTAFDISVDDDVLGPIPGSPIDSLAPGESVWLKEVVEVKETVKNVVLVTGKTASGAVCEDKDWALVKVLRDDDKLDLFKWWLGH